MKQLSVMIKPASSLCNMRCRYCFYANVSNMRDVRSYGIMQDAVAEEIIKNIYADLDDGDIVTFAFQGGEPTLAGLPYFEKFVDAVASQNRKVAVSYALQTNGMLIDDSWCVFLKKHNFLVGISIDGDAKLNNKNRFDEKGKGTYSTVIGAKKMMDRYRIEYNVLCVLTNDIARYPQRIWNFILEEKIKYIQFIPCLDDLDANKNNENSWVLKPARFHSFYLTLFALWKRETEKNNYISVKLFDDIVNMFVRQQVTACGLNGKCNNHCIVEADGGVYPCDFYVLDKYYAGNIAQEKMQNIREKTVACGFIEERNSLPEKCSTCHYKVFCNGGCKRMEKSMYLDNSGFCGYKKLLDDIMADLCRIGRLLIS